MNDEFFRQLERAVGAASRHEKELLRYPNVVMVGAGPARRGGVLTGEAAIVVTVRRKLGPDELGEGHALPQRVDDVRVDVIEQDKPVEAPEIVAAQKTAKAALERVSVEWLAQPNVTALAIGYKTVAGEPRFTTIAIKVFVRRKLPLSELKRQGLRPVPPEIDGVPTDVLELPPMRPTSSASGSRDDRKDPLVGGLTVGVNTKPFWFGTLGAIVFDRGTGQQLVLSNQHVLDGAAGTEVVQPSPIGLDDSLEIGFQLDICNPAHFFRLDTPNTTVGSVLAGAAVAAAVAAALRDEIDPTRRGQDATVPPAGALTFMERQDVNMHYPELPIPGTHFTVETKMRYTRHTTVGDQTSGGREKKVNPHALADKLLLTDRILYHPGESVRLFGLILPEPCAPRPSEANPSRPITADEIRRLSAPNRNFTAPSLAVATKHPTLTVYGEQGDPTNHRPERPAATAAAVLKTCRCDRYHAVAILTPTREDRAFPVVLREPSAQTRDALIHDLLNAVSARRDDRLLDRVFPLLRYGCFYTGELRATDVPFGPWKHYLFVQTVNVAPANLKPVEAAQIIGGLPVSQNTKPALDVACGPVVYEDGQFDIELL